MIACLSPNGQNTTRGNDAVTKLLVATVEGISVLEREHPGASWQNRGHKLEGKHCSSIMIEPKRGGIFAGFHENGGLYFSADNGETWERRMNGLTIDHVFSVAYAHHGDNIVLYAGTEPASIFRSDDYGLTWVEQTGVKEAPDRDKWLFPGKPHIPHVKSITVSLADPNMVWALVEQGALMRTTDGGATWLEQKDYSKPEDHNYRDVHQLTMHPVNTNELWLTTGMGAYHSLDSGEKWEQITDTSFRVGYPDHTFVSPLDPDTMFVSGAMMYPGHWKKVNRADPTVMKSRDRGRTWTDSSEGLPEDRRANIEAMSLAIYPGGFSLFVGNTDGEVYQTDDAAEHWTQIASALGPVSKIYHYKEPAARSGVIAHERAQPASGVSPIAGLKVFDFTHVFAGPFCTRTLADLGADVVHVESPSRDPGDRHRATYAHRNKRSIALDLKSEAGHAVATQLAMGADVIVENFSADVMRRLKLDYDTLSKNNPRLIYISLSGYGHTGPRKSWTSMNMNLQAYTGLMLTTGAEGDPPTAISNSWNDYIGGLHGIIAVLEALTERAETGRGRNIDLSQFECSVATVGALLMASAVSGKPPKRWGNRSSSAAPQGAYPCGGTDEWCVIVAETDAQWRSLANAIGRADLAGDERFASVVGRMRHHDELDAAIEAWTRGRLNTEVERVLQTAGVPAERMRRVDDVVESPDSGGAYRPVPGQRKKALVAPSVPFTFSKSTVEAFTPPCALGEHTDEVLRDWLGLDAAEIASLQSRNAFGAERTN